MTTNNDGRPDLLERLTKLNPTVVVLATVLLFLAILLLPDLIAAAVMLLLAVGLALLLSRTWPVLASSARTVRLVVIGLLLVIATFRVVG